MPLQTEKTFWSVTIACAAAAFFLMILLLSGARMQGMNQGKEVYNTFVQNWNRFFSVIAESEQQQKNSRDFLEWFQQFTNSNPAIEYVRVGRLTGRPVFSWQTNAPIGGDVLSADIKGKSSQFFDHQQNLPVQMRYRTISNASIILLFRSLGALLFGYIVFLAIFFLSRKNVVQEGSTQTENFSYHDDIQTIPIPSSVQPTAKEPQLNQFGTSLMNQLQKSAEQERNLSLIFFQVNPRESSLIDQVDLWLIDKIEHANSVFALPDNTFALILPDYNTESALTKAHSIINAWPGKTARCGISSRNERLISPDRLIREAHAALQKAYESQETVIAFKPDPDKYRSAIARNPHMQ